jgi:hypothetical protein
MTGGGDYHSCLDEYVLDKADYITCTAVGRQTFGFTAYAIPAGCTITSVTVILCGQANGAGVARIGESLKVGGNYYNGIGYTPYDGEWTYFTETLATNPKSGAAWTLNDVNGIGVNALQAFGVYSDDCAPTVSCSQCWLEVNFTPGVAPLALSTGNIGSADMPTTNYGEMRFVLWAWIVVQVSNDLGADTGITVQPSKWGHLYHDSELLGPFLSDGTYVTISYAIPWMMPSSGCSFNIWADRGGANLVYWAWGVYCTRYNPYGCLDSKTVDYTAHFDYAVPFTDPTWYINGGNYQSFNAWSGGAEVGMPDGYFVYLDGGPNPPVTLAGVNLADEVWLGKTEQGDNGVAENLPFAGQAYCGVVSDLVGWGYHFDTQITQLDLPDDTGGCSGDPIAVWGEWRGCTSGGGDTLWRHTNFARKVGGLWDVQILNAAASTYSAHWCFSRGDEVVVFELQPVNTLVWRSTDRGATFVLSADIFPDCDEMLYVPMSDTLVALTFDVMGFYYTRRSTDFGATWDAAILIPGSDDDAWHFAQHAQFCHDENGALHLVTFDETDFYKINYYHSHDLGTTWTKQLAVLDANALPFPDWEGYPLVLAEGGKVLVAMDVAGDDVAAGVDECCYVIWATSTDGGDSFGAQQSVYMNDRTDDVDGLWAQMYGGEVYLYWIGWYDYDKGILYGHYPQDSYYATFYVKSTGWGVGAPVFADPGGGEVLHGGIIDYSGAMVAYRIDPNSQLSAHVIFEPSSWYLQYTDPRGPWGWWNWSGHIYEMNPTDWGPLMRTQDPGWRSGGGPDCSLPEYYEWTWHYTAHAWIMQRPSNLWVQHI